MNHDAINKATLLHFSMFSAFTVEISMYLLFSYLQFPKEYNNGQFIIQINKCPTQTVNSVWGREPS